MDAHEQLEALGLSPEEADGLAHALRIIALLPMEKLQNVMTAISRSEAVGPFIDPTFFVRTPDAFENGRRNKELFRLIVALKRHLEQQA